MLQSLERSREAVRYYKNGEMFGSPLFPNTPNFVIRCKGKFDLAALTNAVLSIIERQEILGSTIDVRNDRVSYKTRSAIPFKIDVHDLRDMSWADDRRKVGAYGERLIWRKFDLEAESPVRVFVLRTSDLDHTIGLVIHHAFTDGIGMGVFLDELSDLYSHFAYGERVSLSTQGPQYIDHLRSLDRWFASPEGKDEVQFWSRTLSGCRPLELRSGSGGDMGVAVETGQIPGKIAKPAAAFARAENVSVFQLYLAVHYAALWAETERDDLTVRIVHGGRSHDSLSRLIASLASNIPCRATVSGDMTFRSLIGVVHKAWCTVKPHKKVPCDMLLAALPETDVLWNAPMFNFIGLPSLVVDPSLVSVSETSDFRRAIGQREHLALPIDGRGADLWDGHLTPYHLNVVHGPETSFELMYSRRRCSRDAAQSILETFTRVLALGIERPDCDLKTLVRP